ncbi:MAG: hypothetical protein ABSD78_13100 [Acidimicrobiales bacterium]
MLTNRHRLVERTCVGCGATWLLTAAQARFRPRPPFGVLGGRMEGNIVGTESFQQFSADSGIEMLDKIRSCPECSLQNYTERAVTKKNPASPNADRGYLT